ncbi:unnamed protein product [Lepeophtheirus salmonis]|uniref:(salmon louse) hypothetical protein n=1 Tax=Lepeophtheirus salmonis TaxID=72036 RepID=A0A7R8CEB9_LEPSM|nr:unnamed protein product [Lepeophtheirus salmonis]CAF2751657.1 unnamed protein product [Lepeophtheirus salmonis]
MTNKDRFPKDESLKRNYTGDSEIPKSNEVPHVVGQFKVCPFWPTTPTAWFCVIEAQFQLYQVKKELEKYHHLLCAIDDKVLDPFDDESEDTLTTQDKIERLFQLIEAPHIHPIDEIVSLARDYLSNVPDVREAIIKQILMRSLLESRRAGLSPILTNLRKKVKSIKEVIDELAIKKHIEFDGTRYHGYVDLRTSTDSVSQNALVFMVTSIHSSYKLPKDYFSHK